MALLKIHTFPDAVLKTRAKEVTAFDSALKKLADDMLETMYDAPGVGLAANQVGVLQRIIVIDADYSVEGEDEATRQLMDQNPRVLVNPVVSSKTGKILFKEGCLSVPGYTEEVQRAEKVWVKYQDLVGKSHEFEADALLAVCVQHEIDHLDGKLFIDRLSMAKRGLIKNKLKKDRGTRFERSRFHVEL